MNVHCTITTNAVIFLVIVFRIVFIRSANNFREFNSTSPEVLVACQVSGVVVTLSRIGIMAV